jgi:endonuclease YncB( thermonuclease family)
MMILLPFITHDAPCGLPPPTYSTALIPALALATLLSTGPFSSPVAAASHHFPPIQGPARVVDGDTLVINDERIRLYGVDAPEKAQVCRQDDCGVCIYVLYEDTGRSAMQA